MRWNFEMLVVAVVVVLVLAGLLLVIELVTRTP